MSLNKILDKHSIPCNLTKISIKKLIYSKKYKKKFVKVKKFKIKFNLSGKWNNIC